MDPPQVAHVSENAIFGLMHDVTHRLHLYTVTHRNFVNPHSFTQPPNTLFTTSSPLSSNIAISASLHDASNEIFRIELHVWKQSVNFKLS